MSGRKIHPRRERIHIPGNIGAKAADSITAFAGSWIFIWLHIIWFTLWFVLHLDVALLTNIVSLEAIFLAALVLMSQSRTYERDKLRDDTEAYEVEHIAALQEEIKEINLRQSEILTLMHKLIETRKAQKKSVI